MGGGGGGAKKTQGRGWGATCPGGATCLQGDGFLAWFIHTLNMMQYKTVIHISTPLAVARIYGYYFIVNMSDSGIIIFQ